MQRALILVGVLTVGIGLLAGCRTVDEFTRSAAEPLGSPLGFTQSVPEGAAKGYASDPTSNPYGR